MNTEVNKEVRNLVEHIFRNEKSNEKITVKEKWVLSQLKKGDTMSFVNKKEMDVSIKKMSEKFQFHGFSPQADYLRKMYDKFMNKTLKHDLTNALNIVRFLLCMSESPVNKFIENPEKYSVPDETDEDNLSKWAEYLLEGIEVYSPGNDEESSDDSDYFLSVEQSEEEIVLENIKPIVESTSNAVLKMDFHSNNRELMSTVQHTWFNEKRYVEKPISDNKEAQIGVLWEEYLNNQTHGLIDLEVTNFISEYKVIREIIWQMFGAHNSFIFCFKGDDLKVRNGVSISSVRCASFEGFMQQFIEYIELMEFFREFIFSLSEFESCQTYLCYASAIKNNVLDPIYQKLIDLEELVRTQEKTYTLMNLAENFMSIFAPLKILREIHHKNVIPVKENSAIYCATSLLCNLHLSLRHSITKYEHDLKIALYLESLYKYLFLVDSWLSRNDFVDMDCEFVLIRVSSTQTLEYKTSPFLSAKITYEVSDEVKPGFMEDGIIKIISTRVLQIAKNIRLLFLLRKFDFYTKFEESLHEELVRCFLIKLCEHFNYTDKDVFEGLFDCDKGQELKSLVFKYPVISSDKCKTPSEMDKLDFIVDTNDSFLMEAFADFIAEPKHDVEENKKRMTLLDRINQVTTGLFPVRDSIEKIFLKILKERYSVSGLMVKGALVEDHHLDKIFEFLRALFLFANPAIFPFFEQLFNEMKILPKNPWRYMKMSSNLKDIIGEIYPMIIDKFDINLTSSNEKSSDPVDICNNLNVEISMKWPINIVITDVEMKVYQNLFKFFVTLKWVMCSLKKLSCKEIFNGKYSKKSTKFIKYTVKKLEVFKFSLLQLLNFIQHYLVCFCLMKCRNQFELDFEKSNDLDSLIKCHCDFIDQVEEMVNLVYDVSDEYGFKSIVQCVKILSSMWTNVELAVDHKVLDAAFNLYKKCNANIHTRVNKMYLINY